MTHTYSRGCFKLIFRKCLHVHTLFARAAHIHKHTRTLDVCHDCPPSRASVLSNDTPPVPSAPFFHNVSRLGYYFTCSICFLQSPLFLSIIPCFFISSSFFLFLTLIFFCVILSQNVYTP